jgi:hypothetical protein
MPDYRRNRIPGRIYFFTVNLLERRSRLLIEHIDAFGETVRRVRARRPFHISHIDCMLESDQNRIREIAAENRTVVDGAPERRTRHLATAILRAYDSR